MNYPNGLKVTSTNKEITYSKRGMNLEDDINASNAFYLSREKAVVYKKPTPVQIVHVDYQRRSAAKIDEAYFVTPSTTDYNGVYNGIPLDFEAKETKSKTAFVLALIHPHQFQHLENVLKQKAVAFLIIRFTNYDQTFVVSARKMIAEKKLGKKSIPYKWFLENGYLCESVLGCPVDYLKVIDMVLSKGEIL